ncbi:MAG TPA: hypothetical protein DEB06_09165 [Phycisphaerales bacterium]|nr:hypothetical protein [Phycisphaerales bacterium]
MILLLIGLVWLEERVRAGGGRPGLVMEGAMLLLGIEAGRELAKVLRARQIAANVAITALAVCTGVAVSSRTPAELGALSGTAIVCTAGSAIMLISMLYYSRRRTTEGVVAATAGALLAFVYVGLMGGFIVVLVKEFSGWVLLGVLAVTKSCDIGAYFTGRALGRHKLIPWLSPGKTWEGLFGGVAFAAAVGAVAGAWADAAGALQGIDARSGALAGALFGLIGQAGDLVASMLKRDAGLKDYSRAVPGFGGLMDIVDSPLLVAPVAYWLLLALEAWSAHAGSTALLPAPP